MKSLKIDYRKHTFDNRKLALLSYWKLRPGEIRAVKSSAIHHAQVNCYKHTEASCFQRDLHDHSTGLHGTGYKARS